MKPADLVVTDCNYLLTCRGEIPKKKNHLHGVGLLEKGYIASLDRRIVFAGNEKGFKEEVRLNENSEIIEGSGLIGLPGFIDSHTHLPFAGTREEEFLPLLPPFERLILGKKAYDL